MLSDCIDAGHTHGLSTVNNYGAGSANRGHAQGAEAGQMLQIFVRADCVDDVAYACQPGGVFIPQNNPLSKFLRTKGGPDAVPQARIFWHPTLFTDTTKTHIFHYAADKKFHQNRDKFRADVRKALAPILGAPLAARTAFAKVEGRVAPKLRSAGGAAEYVTNGAKELVVGAGAATPPPQPAKTRAVAVPADPALPKGKAPKGGGWFGGWLGGS